jgi:hypothetical protein
VLSVGSIGRAATRGVADGGSFSFSDGWIGPRAGPVCAVAAPPGVTFVRACNSV